MSFPVWDQNKIKQYRGRWDALQRVDETVPTGDSSRSETGGGGTGGFDLDELSDKARQLFEDVDMFGRPQLRYETVIEGLSHLLFTQEGNPPTRKLLHHLDGQNNRQTYYHELELPKKRGGTRQLAASLDPLKWVQRSVLIVFTHLFPRHKCAHGFERGKSIVTHAKQHTNKRFVYTIDIKDFFPSITRNRIFGMLQAYPINATRPVARYLANLTCYKGALPQGAPTSPILSNLICRRLDSRLFKWARQNGYTYSRYADDLTFSTNKGAFPQRDRHLIHKTVRSEGFDINEDKSRLQPYYQRQMVTGIVVNEKANLPREKLRGLRALLHNIDVHGWTSQVGRQALFDTADEWRTYITATLPASEFHKHEKKQREEHLLVNPATRLPHVTTADKLREVVGGMVSYVGAVRGQDDRTYLRMKKRYDRLSKRLDRFTEEVQKGRKSEAAKEINIRDQQTDAPDEMARHEEEEARYYPQAKKWIEALNEGDLSPSEFRENLAEWTDRSLEMAWFLRAQSDADVRHADFLKRVRQIAYALDLDPEITSNFLLKQGDQRSFKGLLHAPYEDWASPEEILGTCQEVFDRYKGRLPNPLQQQTMKMLAEVESWIEANPKEYPWPPDGQTTSVQSVLQKYKEDTRLGPIDFIERMEEKFEGVRDEHGVEVQLPEFGIDFRTHVPALMNALKKIVASMAQHTVDDAVIIEMEEVEVADGRKEIVVIIRDENGQMPPGKSPDLVDIFSGDTGDALYYAPTRSGLRGLARWTLTAAFDDGQAYEFDVMKDQRQDAPHHTGGVVHRITLPKGE